MRAPFFLPALALLIATSTASAFDVTACHQTVPSGEVGVLQVDLVCDSNGGPNVNIGRGARLMMNGHSISGGYIGVASAPGLGSKGTLEGPGEIFGAGGDPFGCAISSAGKMLVKNVDLHDNRRGIVRVYDFAMTLEDVTIRDNAMEGIRVYGSSHISGGPGKGQLTGRNVTIAGNGDAGIILDGALKLRDSTITGNGGLGIDAVRKRVSLKTVSVTDNVAGGLRIAIAQRANIKGSTLTGNGPLGDIAAPVAPHFVTSTCDASVDTRSGGTLGICAGD